MPCPRERTVDGIVAKFMEVVPEFAAHVAAQAPVTAPAAVVAAAPAISAGAVTDSLLGLIAERTGYPPEMLDAKLDLEADLGIDSIKRVEILGELRTHWLKDAGEAAQERMGPVSRERTVDGIVAKFMEVVAEFTAPVAARSHEDAVRKDLTDWHGRFVMIPRRVAAPTPQKALVAGRTYAVTGPNGDVTALLAKRIEAAGASALRITSLEDAEIRAALAGVDAPLGGLFHVWPLTRRAATSEMTAADWAEAVDGDLRTLYSVLNAVGAELAGTPGGFVLAASAMGGAFGFDGAMSGAPSAAGAPGFLKSAAKEWEALHVRAVDMEASLSPEAVVEILVDEAGRRGGEVEIGWKGGVRFDLVAELRPLVHDATLPVEGLGPDDVVLVTGGARGITAKIVRHLAAHHGPRFVLLGSSPLDTDVPSDLPAGADERAIRAHLVAGRKAAGLPLVPAEIEAETRRLVKAREMAETLDAVRASGCDVEYISADVRDADAFGAAIAGVYDRHGRIDVALHGAGVIEDKLIADKTLESFENVVRTKTGSAFTLARALRMDTVKCLVFFTSVAGRFGNRGQGDYGAGNEIVSKLARTLDASVPGRVVAISWGPWDSGGMVTAEIKAQFSRLGIEAIDPANGVAALEVELQKGAAGEPEVVWGRGPWEEGGALHREVAE
ncbi:MAG: SDR family NAD(P)-dependent oxidoreductase [Paracoccaceae bacterium]